MCNKFLKKYVDICWQDIDDDTNTLLHASNTYMYFNNECSKDCGYMVVGLPPNYDLPMMEMLRSWHTG